MRIIGGHDYYDTALSFGHDEHTVFVRGDESLSPDEAAKLGIMRAEFPAYIRLSKKLRGKRDLARYAWRYRRYRPDLQEVQARAGRFSLTFPTVIACGKRYQGVQIIKDFSGDPVFVWHANQMRTWMAEHNLEPNDGTDEHLEAYFAPVDVSKAVLQTLIDRRWTLLVQSDGLVPHDGRGMAWAVDQAVLKHVEFYKVIDPNRMFQEIDMWLGGVLPATDTRTVEVSDEVRMAKHGMDKTSFRKPKSKK